MQSSFPPLYARWMEALLGSPVPEEPRATCGACPMVIGEGAELRFNAATKCCTFFPELPSFSVGRLFLDDDPALATGRERVLARLELGQQVTPAGVGRPGPFYVAYSRKEVFGRHESILCPYYLPEGTGMCAVWRHREATCATWFCKHERGQVGLDFWSTMRLLLKGIEERLVEVVAVELGIAREAIEAIESTMATLRRDREPEYYARIWSPWAGRELEYYKRCAEAVSDLDWAGVRARCGEVIAPLVQAVEKTWAARGAAPRLPDLVRIRPFRRVGKEGDTTLLGTYSPYDSMEVHDRTLSALMQHEEAPLEQLLAELGPLGVDRPLLERMLDAELIEDGAK